MRRAEDIALTDTDCLRSSLLNSQPIMAPAQVRLHRSLRHAGTLSSSRLAIFAFLLVFLSSQALAASAVLGIDVGTEYIKAALVKPGVPLEIVLTKDTRRKQAAAVAFKPSTGQSDDGAQYPERLYGHDALAVAARFPGDVYSNLKPLLGLVPDGADALVAYGQRYPGLDLVRNEKQGLVGIRSQTFGSGDGLFSVEELLAMELMSIKENAEEMAGKGHTIRDVVITVPIFYTAEERAAMETAAELAGMKVVGLISDGLAVGLNYATSRTFPNVDKGEKPEHHLVFDMGAGSTTATVLKFQARMVKDVGRFNKTIQEVSVIGTGWDRSLGGDALNHLIVEDMVSQFVGSNAAKKENIEAASVKKHGRTMAKLWKESERIRQVLSANTATSANFEGLHDDVDFRYKLTRADFETLASSYAGKVTGPLKEALSTANLTVEDLDSIILHGGLVRTPFIQTELEKIAPDPAKIKSNVNADESAVFGAAFKAAGLSPSFRVKEIRSNDVATYPILFKWTADGKERQQKVFVPTSQVGAVKQLPFKISADFVVTAHQVTPLGGERIISDFSITNITAAIDDLVTNFECERSAITTTLSVRLSPVNGLPEFVEGSARCEVVPSLKKSGVVDDVKGFFGFGGKKDEKPLADGETSAAEASSAASSTSQEEASSTATKKTAPSKAIKVPKKKIQVNNFIISPQASGSSSRASSDLQRMKERLVAFDESDQNRRLREESFNKLEGFTYRTRDLLTDSEIIAVSTESQRTAIEKLLSTSSEWLYTDGTTASTKAVKAKLQAMRDLVNPVQKRKDEAVKRPQAIKRLQDTLNQTQSVVEVVRNSIEQASSAAEAASLTSSSTAMAPTFTADALDDPEDEPSITSSSAPVTAPTSTFSEDDLAHLKLTYESIEEWFATESLAQSELSPFDDPVLLSIDIDRKAEQLNKLMVNLLSRQTRTPPKPKPSVKVRTPKAKSKTSAAKTVASSEPEASPIVSVEDFLEATLASIPDDQQTDIPDVPEPGPTPVEIHDEL